MTIVEINRGSDADFTIIWPGDLTGRWIGLFEPHPALAGHLTLSIAEASEAETVIAAHFEWDAGMPCRMEFRVATTLGEDQRTSQKMMLVIK